MKNETGTYGPELFTRKAIERIQQHDSSQPMFLYVAQQAVHSANVDEPLQAPAHIIKVFLGFTKSHEDITQWQMEVK